MAGLRARELDFFVKEGDEFKLVTLWKKKPEKELSQNVIQATKVRLPKRDQYKTDQRVSPEADLYPVGWRGPKYINGYKGKKFDSSFLRGSGKAKNPHEPYKNPLRRTQGNYE